VRRREAAVLAAMLSALLAAASSAVPVRLGAAAHATQNGAAAPSADHTIASAVLRLGGG
jgi:hypothetical protein